MSDLEEDTTDSTPCDKVRYCSNCKQPCKGHDGPTGRNCKYKITEHIPTTTGEDFQPLMNCLIDQMRKISLGLDAIQVTQEKMLEKLDKLNVPARTVRPAMQQEDSVLAGLNIPERAIQSARMGEFCLLQDFNPTLDPKTSNELETVANSDGTIELRPRKPQKSIDNFYLWLRCWNNYEYVVVSCHPEVYKKLTHYRQFIQDCDRKFNWAAVYSYDLKFRSKVASSSFPFNFDEVDHVLYTTILEATAVKPSLVQCFRCKGTDHVVQQCPFLAPHPSLEETQKMKRTVPAKKVEKWYHQGKEGCNNFQQGKCSQSNCIRAHVSRQCRGPDPWLG